MALLALLTVVAAGCTESAPPVDTSSELGPAQEVQALLDARAEALADGDVDAFLAALGAPARAVEEPVAEQAARMPLSEIRLRLLDPTFSRRAVGGEQVAVADNTKVDFVFRYEGLPEDNLFRFRLRYDLEERDDGWAVTDAQLVIPDAETHVPMPPMWALGPTTVARSEHFLALHRPGLADPTSVLALAEDARGQLAPKLTLEADPAHVVQIAETTGEYVQIISPASPAGSVAVASWSYAGAGYASSPVPQNRHMSVNLQAVFAEQLPPEEIVETATGDADSADNGDADDEGGHGHAYEPETTPIEVFQHELGHLALSRFTRSSTPVWVAEGGAMELAGEQRTQSWRQGLDDGTFEAMSLTGLSKRDPDMGLSGMEYAYVNAAVSALVEEFGADRFWEFYRDFKDFEMGSAGTPLEQIHADGTTRLLFRTYDIGEQDLDERALAWMRAHASPQ